MSDNAEFRSSGAKTPYGDALDKIDSLRAELARWQDVAVKAGMDNLDTAIAWGDDVAALRAELAAALRERDAVRDALEMRR